jgi:hypothetical protein
MNEEGTHDLAWWRIPRWVPAWPRAVATVAVIGLVSAFIVWPLAGPIAHMHLLTGFQAGPLRALAAVFARGLGYAFMFGPGLLLASPPGGGSPPAQEQLRWSRTDILMILLLAVGVGVGSGLEHGLLGGPKYGLVSGLVSSFVVGLGFVLGGGPPQRLGLLGWSTTDTRTNLRTGLVVGLVVGLGYGLQYGLKYGFMVGIGYMSVIVVGGRTSPQRNQLRWSRTTTPTALLTGLVAGPVYWLLYQLMTGGRSGFGLALGLPLGLGFGLTAGLLLGSRPPMEATSPLDPQSLWRRECQDALVYGLTGGLVAGLGSGLVSSATWAAALATAQLQRRDKAPAHLLRFLDDARQRQVLRTVGPVYQFRDARLQNRLAEEHETMVGEASGPQAVLA